MLKLQYLNFGGQKVVPKMILFKVLDLCGLMFFRNPTTENSKYTISITDLAIPDGATTVLLVSHDLNANPWPGAVGVSIKGN